LAGALAIALLPLPVTILLVAGGILVVATLVRPQLGVLLIVAAVPFGSWLPQVSVGPMNVGATEALVVFVLAAWLMQRVARRDQGLVMPPLTLPILLLLGVMLVSTLVSVSVEHSIKEIIKWVEVLALYLLVANKMGGRWTGALFVVFLGTGALVALLGIYQFLFQVGPEGFVLFDRFMRAYGTFDQPNPYGGYLGLTLPLAVGLVLAWIVPRGKRPSRAWLVLATCCGLLMVLALVMSWSRGAWLGFGAALVVMALAVVVQSGRATVLGAVLLGVIAYGLLAGGLARVPPAVLQRFTDFLPYVGTVDVRGLDVTDANFAVLERLAHWQAALDMWTDFPWLGVGIGNYVVAYPGYALPLWPLALGHAHNYYLNIAAETGVVGLVTFLLLVGSILVAAWRAGWRSSGWRWGLALGILGVVVHLSIHHLFDNLFVHGMYLHVAILLGTIQVLVPWREPA
jgi:putative inorganic carbon (HCO3(-)) transporter